MANVSEILDSINSNVLTGGRRTKASGVRETLALIAESYLNKEDDANVAGGYLKISDTEIVDVSFIKKASPTGQFLKDDGTWADAESLNTNTVFLSNDDSTYNSGWADGDTLLAEKNTIYYLQNASPGETLNITIDETDVPVGSMVAFTDGQAAGNGINGTARILGVRPSGDDSQVYSGETLVYRYDGFDWRLMMRYSRNLISQSIASGATRFAPSSDAVFTALAGKVDTIRTLTINGVTQNLSANRTWTIDALPSQTGNSGKFLSTNGSVASWASLTSTNITDALTYTPVSKAGDTLSGFLTLHADPTNSMHAVTKNYVDNLLTGLTWKEKVRVATTANIILSGTQTIDGVSANAGDRVLVKNQSTQTQNGIYIVSASTWTRSNDADTGAEILTAAVLVTAGTTQANTQWTCSNSTTPTIGSTNITFAQIAGAGVYTNGTGISLIGNAFSISNSYAGQTSITTLGIIGTGTWQGTPIEDTYIASAATWNGKLGPSGGTLAGALNYAPSVTIASSATTDIGNANSNNIIISGTTTITSFGTVAEGVVRIIRFTGALTLTHNATSLILPNGSNITTQANDTAIFRSMGSGNWVCISYKSVTALNSNSLSVFDGTKFVNSFLSQATDSTGITYNNTSSNQVRLRGLSNSVGRWSIFHNSSYTVMSSLGGVVIGADYESILGGYYWVKNGENQAYNNIHTFYNVGGTKLAELNSSGLALGTSTINALTQLDLQSTTKGLGLNLVAGDLGTTRNGLIWYDTVGNLFKGVQNSGTVTFMTSKMPSNTVKTNNAASTADAVDLPLTSETVLGRTASVNSGNIAPIPLQASVSAETSLVAGTRTITDSRVTANTIVMVSPSNTGTLNQDIRYTKNAGVSVVFTAGGSDTCTFSYIIIF